MKISPRRHDQTICCGLFAIAMVWSTTAVAQQARSNPLRQRAAQTSAEQTPASAPRTENELDLQAKVVAKTGAAEATSRPSERVAAAIETSPVRQAAYQTSREDAIRVEEQAHEAIPLGAIPHESSALHVQDEGFVVQKGIFQKGGSLQEGGFVHEGGLVQKGGIVQKGGKGGCNSCDGGGCFQCYLPCLQLSLDNVEFFGGTQGFSGPANRGGTGSFGFHEGFNIGMPLPCTDGCVGVQFGLRATQNNLSGSGFPADAVGNSLFTDSTRTQTFMTLGLFRRVDWGLQGGLAVDYLADNWYTDVNIAQLRGEASWVFPCAHELGFMFSTATDEDTQVGTFNGGGPLTETWEGTKQYAFFYRHRPTYVEGAEARIFAGWSGDNDGIIGSDIRLPLSDSLALEIGASYLIPEQANTGAPGGGHEEESWNLGISFVWYPGCRSAFGGDYFRPLLNVADNGSFRVGRR